MADKEKAILQALWKKAARQDEPVTVVCRSQADAHKLRFALYNAVKAVRKHPDRDQELVQAVEACALSLTDDKRGVVIRQKTSTAVMQAAMAALGVTGADALKDDIEVGAEEALRHLQDQGIGVEMPVNPALQPKSNPYK